MTGLILMAVIAAISLLVGGAAIGYPLGRRAERAITASGGPVCGCRHNLSMHDGETNRCHDKVKRVTSTYGTEWVSCPCRRYVGPEPITAFWTPPPSIE